MIDSCHIITFQVIELRWDFQWVKSMTHEIKKPHRQHHTLHVNLWFVWQFFAGCYDIKHSYLKWLFWLFVQAAKKDNSWRTFSMPVPEILVKTERNQDLRWLISNHLLNISCLLYNKLFFPEKKEIKIMIQPINHKALSDLYLIFLTSLKEE